MPLIQISQTPGLTTEQKAAVIAAVTKRTPRHRGKNESSVWVTLTEVPRENWGRRRGGSARLIPGRAARGSLGRHKA